MFTLESSGDDDDQRVGRDADGVAGEGRAGGAAVGGFPLAAHLLERHLGDAVLSVLVDHGADGALLLHHLVVPVPQPGQPRLVPCQLTVAY